MRATSKFTFILLVTILFGLASCNKDEFKDNILPADLVANDPQSINEVRSLFAQTLAKALQDEEVRTYFHEQMQKVNDTDYEWIYLAEKDQIVTQNKRMADILKEHASAEILKNFGENFFDAITEISPLLSVSMPDLEAFNASTWDKSFTPNVVAVLDGPSYSYKMYDQDGSHRFYTRSEIEAAINDPVLSVWDAEAHYLVQTDGNTSWGHHIDQNMPSITGKASCFSAVQPLLSRFPTYTFAQQTYHLVEHNAVLQMYNDCLGFTVVDEAGGGPKSACARDNESLDERVAQFKINNWGVFTNIRNQFLESRYVFHGDVAFATINSFGNASPGAAKYVSSSLKKKHLLNCSGSAPCRGKYITAGYRIWTDWDQEEFGSPYKVAWAEVDNGSTTFSFSVSLTAKFIKTDKTEVSAGVTVGFSRTGAAIVLLGDAPVFYCDPIMRDNNTGSVTYRSN